MTEHVTNPLFSSVSFQLITAELPSNLISQVPRVVPLPLFAADPTKLSPAPSARHMLAGSVLGNGRLALNTVGDEQISKPLFVLPL